MTYKEAADNIKYECGVCKDLYNMSCEECINKVAIEALEKVIKYRWHDLRKDPNDLPTEEDYFDCIVDSVPRYSVYFLYDKEHGFGELASHFDDTTGEFTGYEKVSAEDLGYGKVIAWKELELLEV